MKPNWSSAPEWANYASQELSGTWYWHAEQPRYQELTGEWISKGQRQIVPKVDVRAQDTLEARPVTDMVTGFFTPAGGFYYAK